MVNCTYFLQIITWMENHMNRTNTATVSDQINYTFIFHVKYCKYYRSVSSSEHLSGFPTHAWFIYLSTPIRMQLMYNYYRVQFDRAISTVTLASKTKWTVHPCREKSVLNSSLKIKLEMSMWVEKISKVMVNGTP